MSERNNDYNNQQNGYYQGGTNNGAYPYNSYPPSQYAPYNQQGQQAYPPQYQGRYPQQYQQPVYPRQYPQQYQSPQQPFQPAQQVMQPQQVQPAQQSISEQQTNPEQQVHQIETEQPIEDSENKEILSEQETIEIESSSDTIPETVNSSVTGVQKVYEIDNISSQSTPVYSHSSTEYSHTEGGPSSGGTGGNKGGKNKQVLLIACSLALALCIGFGGGVLGGAMLQGSGGTSAIAADTSETSQGGKENSSDSKKDDSQGDVSITESSNMSKTTSTLQEVVNKVKDSVVEIKTESSSYSRFYGQYIMKSAGSGVIISTDGYIITNHHVVDGASTIEVTCTDGNTYSAKVIGEDSVYDVALIKIDAKNLTAATLGDSSKLSIAEPAIVIGNSLGKLGGTVTAGIISSLNRVVTIDGQRMELLQTDAAINPGNSGGGLFDMNGDLVGIVNAKTVQASDGTTAEGIGYAIPINNVKSIINDLKNKGYVSGRASMGVKVLDVLSEYSKARYGVDREGVYIYEITRSSAAEKAGLIVGDCILKIGDYDISSSDDVGTAMLKYRAGDKIKIVIYRDGKEKTIDITLDEASTEKSGGNSNNFHYDTDDSDDYSFFFE